jgi:hypothetical protein
VDPVETPSQSNAEEISSAKRPLPEAAELSHKPIPSTGPSPESIFPSTSPVTGPTLEIPTPELSSSDSKPPPPESINPITDEQYKAFRGKQATGPFTWKALALFLLTGAGLIIYFRQEKERMQRLRGDHLFNHAD